MKTHARTRWTTSRDRQLHRPAPGQLGALVVLFDHLRPRARRALLRSMWGMIPVDQQDRPALDLARPFKPASSERQAGAR